MNCGTCRYWDSSEADLEGEELNATGFFAYGPCTRIQLYSSEIDASADYMPAYVNAAAGTERLDGFVTHINFGCALHSPTEVQDDEAYFWRRLFNEAGGPGKEPRKTPRDIILEPGFPLTRARAGELLEWWDGKGWYTYGVSLELGWLTGEGEAVGLDLKKDGPEVSALEKYKAEHLTNVLRLLSSKDMLVGDLHDALNLPKFPSTLTPFLQSLQDDGLILWRSAKLSGHREEIVSITAAGSQALASLEAKQ